VGTDGEGVARAESKDGICVTAGADSLSMRTLEGGFPEEPPVCCIFDLWPLLVVALSGIDDSFFTARFFFGARVFCKVRRSWLPILITTLLRIFFCASKSAMTVRSGVRTSISRLNMAAAALLNVQREGTLSMQRGNGQIMRAEPCCCWVMCWKSKIGWVNC